MFAKASKTKSGKAKAGKDANARPSGGIFDEPAPTAGAGDSTADEKAARPLGGMNTVATPVAGEDNSIRLLKREGECPTRVLIL